MLKILNGWINYIKDAFGLLNPKVKAVADDRLAVCRSNICNKLILGICSVCGCPVNKKTKVMTEECPENMWNPVVWEDNGLSFIRISEVPEEVREEFRTFMRGQTRPYIEDLDPNDAV